MTTTSEQTQIPPTATTEQQAPNPPINAWRGKRLYRSRDQRMVGGVGGGIAEYLGVDPTIVRLGFVLTAFFGGAGVIAYVVGWLIIPEA